MNRAPLFAFVVVALSLVGCKKAIPDPWKDYGFPTESLKEVRGTPKELDATYASPIAPLAASALLDKYGQAVTAKGYTKTCSGEHRYSDGDRAFFDGYAKGADKLSVFTVFGDSATRKDAVEVVVSNEYDKHPIYGALVTNYCKPAK